MNGLVMYDRQTDGLWSQILGEAITGPMAGTRLEPIPSVQSTWSAWREHHPDTLALQTRDGGLRDGYAGYYGSGRTGVRPETRLDDRLGSKTLVTGSVIEQQAAAWPWPILERERVVNDRVAGRPILVAFEARARSSLVYDRRVDGRTLRFLADPEPGEALILKDLETGSRWTAWSGAAFEGPLAGKQLSQIAATTAFWFGWKDYHPETQLYGMGPK